MSKFVNPTEELVLTIEVEGKKKKVKVATDKHYLLDRNGSSIPVLKHDALVNIADANGFKVEKTILEFGAFNSPSNYCFIHRSYGVLANGVMVDEVGEANPNNLDTNIGSQYPAIMSNKRSQDRLLIRLMGLTGQIYSDVEFGGKDDSNASSQKQSNANAPAGNTTQTDNMQDLVANMTLEEVKALIVDYGTFKKNPITLGELKETQPEAIEWLINGYKVNKNSSEKMKKLHEGAKRLVKES
jgi:hypothetical protein